MRRLAAAAGVAMLAAGLPVAFAGPAQAVGACERLTDGGTSNADLPWAQGRLDWQSVWQTTRGAGVTVAVVDSGFTAAGAQLRGIHVAPGVNVTGTEPANYTDDCGGSKDAPGGADIWHGTLVTSVLAAQPDRQSGGQVRNRFAGVAPDVTVLPVKADPNGPTALDAGQIAAGIRAAVDRGANIVNVSAVTAAPTAALSAAVQYAASRGVVIVAAAGNKPQQSNGKQVPEVAQYPAAFAGTGGRCTNVVSVGAIAQDDTLWPQSLTTSHTTVVAPGDSITVIGANGRYRNDAGTSFAAPFVSGTVALMRSAHPSWTPQQICQQLQATAQTVPVQLPNAAYGYGIVDPVGAVTSPLSSVAPQQEAKTAALPPVVPRPAPDRSTQDRAVAVAAGLLGLAVIAAVAGAVLRRTRRRDRVERPGSALTTAGTR